MFQEFNYYLYIFLGELPPKLLVEEGEHGGGGEQGEGGDLAGPLHLAQAQHPLQPLHTLPPHLACTTTGVLFRYINHTAGLVVRALISNRNGETLKLW